MTGPELSALWSEACRLQAAGRLAEAVAIYERVAAAAPGAAPVFGQLGQALRAAGRHQEALAAFRRAAALDDALMPAHLALARALAAAGRPGEAAAHLAPLVARQPRWGRAAAHVEADRGAFLTQAGRAAEGEAAARRAVAIDPGLATAHLALGGALATQDRAAEAVGAFDSALRLSPDNVDALTGIAGPLAALGRVEEAVASAARAAELAPRSAVAQYNLAVAARSAGRYDEALAAATVACSLRPDYASAQWERALLRLRTGDLPGAWPDFERWLREADGSPRRVLPGARWDGRRLPEGTLLISAEWGFGDFLQFVRYATLAAERVGRVVVEAPAELVELARTVPGVAATVARGAALPRFDVHVPLMGLPGLFDTGPSTIPGRVPYVTAEAARVDAVRQLIDAEAAGALRVGIVWGGRPEFSNDLQRSTHLRQWEPLFGVPGVRLFSLQHGAPARQLVDVTNHGITDLAPRLPTFADTAAAMMALDLVVTTCTAPAHLAGALGRPVWTLLMFASDWRWFVGRDESPWYPTMRLFRQRRPGDWQGVFERVAAKLRNEASPS